MGKRSLQKIELDDYFRRLKKWRDRLKPPYLCPICFLERAVHVKKEEITKILTIDGQKKFIQAFKFEVYCQYGCFRKSFSYESSLYDPVDVYCEVVDTILKRSG